MMRLQPYFYREDHSRQGKQSVWINGRTYPILTPYLCYECSATGGITKNQYTRNGRPVCFHCDSDNTEIMGLKDVKDTTSTCQFCGSTISGKECRSCGGTG